MTALPEINTELFQKIHDQITIEPDTHEQADWVTEHSCGTTFCVAGWAVELTARALGVDRWDLLSDEYGGNWSFAGEDLLGLTYGEGHILFGATNARARELVERYALKGREFE